MLTTIFVFNGKHYRSSRIPDSFEGLKLAASKIVNLNEGRAADEP